MLFNYRCLCKYLLFNAVIIICCVCLVYSNISLLFILFATVHRKINLLVNLYRERPEITVMVDWA